MPVRAFRARLSLFLILTHFLCTSVVSARHVHNRPQHQHLPRQDWFSILDTLGPVIPAPTPSATDDLQAQANGIVKCLDELPGDITAFIQALDARLKGIEGLLGDLVPGSIRPSSIHQNPPFTVVSRPTPTPTDEPTTIDADLPPIDPPSSSRSPTVSLCKPPHGAGPLVPCSDYLSTRTRTTHLTRTSTFYETVTYHIPMPVGNITNVTFANVGPSDQLPATTTISSSLTHTFAGPLNLTTITDYFPGSASIRSVPRASVTAKPIVFNPSARDNVAVYYGSSQATTVSGLLDICENENVDIVILSFVYDFFSQGNYPSVDFGPACNGQNAWQGESAKGLKDCTVLGPQITTCQKLGKKVLVSLGGYVANSGFETETQATQFASRLWDLFGAPTGRDTMLRPFGPNVVVDGFDIDNENHAPAFYDKFAAALRQQFARDSSKTYYISAAPQCPIPDASIPLAAMQQADFIFVQFYNNPSCNLNGPGFQNAFARWSELLSNGTSSGGPKLYIGGGAWPGAGSGYVDYPELQTCVSEARELDVGNIGGMMLWDGSEALQNQDGAGNCYLDYAKWALQN